MFLTNSNGKTLLNVDKIDAMKRWNPDAESTISIMDFDGFEALMNSVVQRSMRVVFRTCKSEHGGSLIAGKAGNDSKSDPLTP